MGDDDLWKEVINLLRETYADGRIIVGTPAISIRRAVLLGGVDIGTGETA
jgi:hypothetical protein